MILSHNPARSHLFFLPYHDLLFVWERVSFELSK